MRSVLVVHDGVDAAACAVDCGRRRFDWLVGDTESVHEAIARLVDAAIVELCWWTNAAVAGAQRRCEDSQRGVRVFLADFSTIAVPSARLSRFVGEQRDVIELDTRSLEQSTDAAEAAVVRLLAQPRALRPLRRRAAHSLYQRCVSALQEVLTRTSLVLEQPERFDGAFQLSARSSETLQCTRLNPAAARVFAAPPSSAQPQSVFGLISRACSSNRGRKQFQKVECGILVHLVLRQLTVCRSLAWIQWVKRPCADLEVLRVRHETVDAFVQLLRRARQPHSHDLTPLEQLARFFRHFQAFERKLDAFMRSSEDLFGSEFPTRLSLTTFVELAQWIRTANELVDARSSQDDADAETNVDGHYFASLRCNLAALLPLCDLIQQVVEFSSPVDVSTDSETFQGDEGVSACAVRLRQLRSEVEVCKEKISAVVSQTAVTLHLQRSRIRVLYDDDDQPGFPTAGVVLRISRQDGHRVHCHNGKLVTIFKASRATGVWFTVPAIGRLGAEWKVLKGGYDAAEQELVRLIGAAFSRQYFEILSQVIRDAGALDALMAFALVSIQHGFVRATSASDNEAALEIVAPFSPFVSEERRTQGWSVHLDSSHYFLLLEGEEVAGDIPLLHLIGTIAVLHQIGCFVPCERATLPLFDAVLLRSGAYDQQLYGFSTFMTEMKEVALILENISPKSLVLIDDLCRGTASSEGLALAMSICSHLTTQGAFVCFSSQWRELTSQVETLQGVVSPVCQSNGDCTTSPEKRRREEDRRFGQLLFDSDMPRELMGLIQQELEH